MIHGFGRAATPTFVVLQKGGARSSPKLLWQQRNMAGEDMAEAVMHGKMDEKLTFFLKKILFVSGMDRNTMIFSTTSSLAVLVFVSRQLSRF